MPFVKGQGGRKKGSKNKRTIARVEAVCTAVNDGITPLDYMLECLRRPAPVAPRRLIGESEEEHRTEIESYEKALSAWREERRWAAATAAPYVHPRLAAQVTKTGEDTQLPAWAQDPGEVAKRMAHAMRAAEEAISKAQEPSAADVAASGTPAPQNAPEAPYEADERPSECAE